MDCQWRDLHDITDIEQVEPLALIQVAQEHLHIDSVFQSFHLRCFLISLTLLDTSGRPSYRLNIIIFFAIWHQILVVKFFIPFLFDHAFVHLFDDRVHSKRRTLEH